MKKGSLALFAALLAALALAIPALAAVVNTPPKPPHEVVVFPERDFVEAAGYRANTDLNVAVKRAGKLVSTARGRTDATGTLEVNHPGGVCWTDLTPDIQPEDVVEVTYANTPFNRRLKRQGANNFAIGNGDASRTINAKVTESAFIDDNGTPDNAADDTLKIKGTAQNPDGTRIDLDLMEQRIIQPDFRDHELNPESRIIRRDIRADASGGVVKGVDEASGTLSYDNETFVPTDPERFNWTATYTGLNPAEMQLAVEGQSRVLSWMATDNTGERIGITIFEFGEQNGPGMGGCPPGPGPVVGPQPPDAPVQGYESAPMRSLIDEAGYPLGNPPVDEAYLSQLHEVVTFPERDFAVAEGWTPGANLQFVVKRAGEVVGTAKGTVGRDGVLEVNHPGGVCWTGQTPDIQPEDVVDVVEVGTDANGAEVATGGERSKTINVTATAARIVGKAGSGNRRLVIDGTAFEADGATPIPLDRLEQRIINPDLKNTAVSRRDIRADSSGGRIEGIPGATGTLYYKATPGHWRAVYKGLDGPGTNNALEVAAEGQTRILSWLAADSAGERYGITIFEVGEQGGPGMGGCPPSGDQPLPDADTTAPNVSISAPASDASVSGQVEISADASDDVGVNGVQFKLDGVNLGAEDTTAPYSMSWDTTTVTNGSHTLTAVARDAAGNVTTSAAVTVTVDNTTGAAS